MKSSKMILHIQFCNKIQIWWQSGNHATSSRGRELMINNIWDLEEINSRTKLINLINHINLQLNPDIVKNMKLILPTNPVCQSTPFRAWNVNFLTCWQLCKVKEKLTPFSHFHNQVFIAQTHHTRTNFFKRSCIFITNISIIFLWCMNQFVHLQNI